MANNNRIVLIDALRGLALAGILLLHHIEHFDFYQKPVYNIPWLIRIDRWVWDNLFLLVSGKAFALFSLLFGLSYWIIHENRVAKGEMYFLRHFWRMFILIILGIFHLVFFRGDILIMYAILGLPLVIAPYMSNRSILILSIVLLINPVNIYTFGSYLINNSVIDFRLPYPKVNINEFLVDGSFLEVLKINLTSGYEGSIVWSWNVGRIFAIPGLFFLGVYFSKTKMLTDKPLRFWYHFLVLTFMLCLVFDVIGDVWVQHIENKLHLGIFKPIIDGYFKLVMMFFMLSLIVIIWRHNNGKVWAAKFSDFGRMGLTNYILMSIIGAILYYGWGAGLYKYCGSFTTFLIGILALIFQMKFSSWWLEKYEQGPLEKIWRKITWIKV
ncbi:hypothetical protein AWE51_19310 [Aquimarina aggregata]|uniref:DUF418 domain-containing protein n=1 Tax=Aquimarina aggregata TaxID=1642818 RepID=A0A162WM72_9FLAO|nr:DUF418 domain-containing protein [Aquimarina aggregata]KZS38188.1 hypothetical protein AWE51_19310 [Aquimarina aggregata]